MVSHGICNAKQFSTKFVQNQKKYDLVVIFHKNIFFDAKVILHQMPVYTINERE